MVAERRRSRREAEIKVYFQTGSAVLCGACSACWTMLHVERCSCSAWEVGMGASYGSGWAWVGLGQCSDGWSGGVVVWQIQSHRIKYNMYLERLAYEPNVSEV